jgi:hypothetical protein
VREETREIVRRHLHKRLALVPPDEAQQFVEETVDKWMQQQSGGPAGIAGALLRHLGGRTDREPSTDE